MVVPAIYFPLGIDESVFGPTVGEKLSVQHHLIFEENAVRLDLFERRPAIQRDKIVIICGISVVAVGLNNGQKISFVLYTSDAADD